MSDNDFSLVGAASSEGATTQYFSSFGKVRIEQKFQKWSGGAPVDIGRDEYVSLPHSRKEAGQGGDYAQIKLIIHLDEAAEIAVESGQPADKAFRYKREIVVNSPDYNNNLLPALEELRGKPWSKGKDKKAAEVAEALSALQGQYVESLDVPQLKWDATANKLVKAEKEAGSGTYWSSFYPVRTFKNRAECVAARKARYNKGASNGSSSAPVATPAPEPEMTRPDSETPTAWKRAIPKIEARLKAKESVESIAADYEVDLGYIEQFVTGVPFSVGVPE